MHTRLENCLKDFWNQRIHGLLDRHRMLSGLIDAMCHVRASAWRSVTSVLCTMLVLLPVLIAGATESEPLLLAGGPKFKVPQLKKPEAVGTPTLKEATQQAKSKIGPPYDTQTRLQLEKSKRSYEALIREHEQKIADYRKNPQAHDNEGRLQGQSPEVQAKIIAGRIKVLEQQIAKQREELR